MVNANVRGQWWKAGGSLSSASLSPDSFLRSGLMVCCLEEQKSDARPQGDSNRSRGTLCENKIEDETEAICKEMVSAWLTSFRVEGDHEMGESALPKANESGSESAGRLW